MWWLISGCAWVTGDEVELYFDRDGDGARAKEFGGTDCDDTDPQFVSVDAFEDLDGDGWGTERVIEVCALGDGAAGQAGDCDDTDPDLTPRSEWFVDGDGDGYGAGIAQVTCDRPAGAVPLGGDCADDDPRRHPGVEGGDRTEDGVDADCDGTDLDGNGDGLPDFADPCEGTDVVEVEPFTYAAALAAAKDCTVLQLASGEYPAGEVPGVGRVAIMAAPGAEVLLQGGASDRAVLGLADGLRELVVEGVRGEGGGAFVEDLYGASLVVSQVETATSRLVDVAAHVPSIELFGYVGTGLDTLILPLFFYPTYGTAQASGTDYYLPPPLLGSFEWRGGAVRASVSTSILVLVDAGTITLTDLDIESSGALDRVVFLSSRERSVLEDVRIQGNIGRYILSVVGTDEVRIAGLELRDNLALEDDPGLLGIAAPTIDVRDLVVTGNEQGFVDLVFAALAAISGADVSVQRAEVVDNAGATIQLSVDNRYVQGLDRTIQLDDLAIDTPSGVALGLDGAVDLRHATLLSGDLAVLGGSGQASACIVAGGVSSSIEWSDVLRVGPQVQPDCPTCRSGSAPFVRAAAGLPTDLHVTCESGAADCAERPVFDFHRTDCDLAPCPVGAYGGQWPYEDSDDDGLYDYWERQFFGNLSRTRDGDADGDGATNHQELHGLGTFPDDPDTDGDLMDDGEDETPLVAD